MKIPEGKFQNLRKENFWENSEDFRTVHSVLRHMQSSAQLCEANRTKHLCRRMGNIETYVTITILSLVRVWNICTTMVQRTIHM